MRLNKAVCQHCYERCANPMFHWDGEVELRWKLGAVMCPGFMYGKGSRTVVEHEGRQVEVVGDPITEVPEGCRFPTEHLVSQ